MKVPHIELNLDGSLDQKIRSKCPEYQACMKAYHDAKHHAAPHKFSIGDVTFCANMKPTNLDSQFHPTKHVIIQTQGRDTFTLVNVTTSTTLIRNAKYLKHAPISEEVIDVSASEHSEKNVSSDTCNSTSNDLTKVNQNASDVCVKGEPTGVTQATQNETSATTRSGHVVKSTQDHDNFVYY